MGTKKSSYLYNLLYLLYFCQVPAIFEDYIRQITHRGGYYLIIIFVIIASRSFFRPTNFLPEVFEIGNFCVKSFASNRLIKHDLDTLRSGKMTQCAVLHQQRRQQRCC